MGWKTSFQPQRYGTIHREEPAQSLILVSCCSTYRWPRRLRRQKARALESPSSAQLAPSSQLKSTTGWLGMKSQQQNQVQINAQRKESFLPLSSLSSPDMKQPQLGGAWGWDQLCFSLIAVRYMRLGETADSWAASAGGQREVQTPSLPEQIGMCDLAGRKILSDTGALYQW